MKNLSRFDIGCIIAFVVIGLLGAGAWYYLSSQLDATKGEVGAAAGTFEQYTKRQPYLPTKANQKILQSNIDVTQAQLDPLKEKLQAKGNKLPDAEREDTVAWKSRLDAEVSGLNKLARVHNVTVPPNFYFGFSRYLNANPSEEQTAVLNKQLLGIQEISTILINSTIKAIYTVRRTYEEDADSGGGKPDSDSIAGKAETAPGGVYVAYPFEVDFEATTDSFRRVIDGLQKSPYIFVIRTISIRNSNTSSPQLSDLQRLSGNTPPVGVLDSMPGAVSNAPKATRGPQFLFGNETLHIKARIDLIDWKGLVATAGTDTTTSHRHGTHGAHGGGNQGNDQ